MSRRRAIGIACVVALVLWFVATNVESPTPTDEGARDVVRTDTEETPNPTRTTTAEPRGESTDAVSTITIRGRAFETGGAPVVGAHITIEPAGSTRTDVDGRFELTVPSSENLTVRARHSAYLVGLVTARVEDPLNVEIAFERGRSIAGTLTFADGTPLPGARIVAQNPHGVPLGGHPCDGRRSFRDTVRVRDRPSRPHLPFD